MQCKNNVFAMLQQNVAYWIQDVPNGLKINYMVVLNVSASNKVLWKLQKYL